MTGSERAALWNKAHREQRNARLRDWCKRNPDKRFGRYLRHRLKTKYGMTVQDFETLLRAQDGKCLICECVVVVTTAENRTRHGKSATVDHNHKTGEVRSVLCNNCNRGLGLFGEDQRVLRNALSYLRIFDAD